MFTREMVSDIFEVDIRTIGRYIEQYKNDELRNGGYQVLKGKRLKDFLKAMRDNFEDINVPTKITIIGIFNFRSFLNLLQCCFRKAKAKILRQMMLDIVIDLINQRTGGGTKYINKRDKGFFISASLQEDNYRRQFTDALKLYVAADQYKYAHFTGYDLYQYF